MVYLRHEDARTLRDRVRVCNAPHLLLKDEEQQNRKAALMAQTAELRVEHITVRYRTGAVAVHDVSLAIQTGLLGLLGPNGAGKTTLMRVLATIQAPSNGAVYWRERNIIREPAVLRRSLGYLSQDFGAPASFTGRQVVRRMGALRGISGRELITRVEETLELVNLRAVANRPAGTYSGGMLRRLGIAQAIVHQPHVLIVDEPTAGLDPEERVQFRGVLADLAQDRIVILSTHIVADLEAVAERIAVLGKGRLIREATIDELLRETQGHVWQVDVTLEEFERLRHDAAIRVASSVRRAGKVSLRLVQRDGTPPSGAEALEPTLEDAYLYLMGDQEGAAS